MMNIKNIIILFLLYTSLISYGQTSSNILLNASLNASGGDFSSETGSISYSLGQLVTKSFSEDGVTFFQGIQLAKEEVTLSVESIIMVNSNELLYPNPTASDAYLSVPSTSKTTSYKLYNAQGAILLANGINTENTLIPTGDLSIGIYYLQLIAKDQTVKTFKLIKK